MDTDIVCMAYIFHDSLVLLTYHKKNSMWLSVGGHSLKGESFLETLRREVYEETRLKPVFLGDAQGPTPIHTMVRGEETVFEFIGEIADSSSIQLDHNELQGYLWINPEDVPEHIDERVRKKIVLATQQRNILTKKW